MFERMQNIDILKCVLATLMSLATIYYLLGLHSGIKWRQEDWERRLKRGGGAIMPLSRLRRVIAGIMCSVFAVQLFAQAFHFSTGAVTGICLSPTMIISGLLLLFMLLGSRDRRQFESKH